MATRRDIGTDDPRVRVRPAKKSRARTRIRPDYSQALRGFVFAVDRGRFSVLLDNGVRLRAAKARELGRRGIVVGDRVAVVGDTSGRPGSLGRIVVVEERRTLLRRSGEEGEAKQNERPVVANADLLVVVAALADPTPRPRLIDRAVVAAVDAKMQAALVLTKADLADPTAFRQAYAPLGMPVIATTITEGAVDETALAELRELLRNRVSVFLGHSGVGKSTLINALVPAAQRATGEVNAVTGKGRHTSTSAVALPLPQGGWVVDTPGIRGFGLAHVDDDMLLQGFVDLAEQARNCPRGCSHLADAPDCYLDRWTRLDGSVSDSGRTGEDEYQITSRQRQIRLDSFRRLAQARLADGESR